MNMDRNRIAGYVNINAYKPIKRTIEPSKYAKEWYQKEGIEYLFKKEKKHIAYRELFYMFIIKYLHLESVENDLAFRGKNFGIISKNYHAKNERVYSLCKILYTYWDNKIQKIEKNQRYELADTISFAYDYNLKRMIKIIKYFFKHEKINYPKTIEVELTLQFIIQILLGNLDLRAPNIEIIINEIPHVAPFYDFTHYGLVNLQKNECCYQFKYNNKNYTKDKISAKSTLEEFLKQGTKREIEMFKEYLEKVEEINLEHIFSAMESLINYKIDDEIKIPLRENYEQNIRNIHLVKKGN